MNNNRIRGDGRFANTTVNTSVSVGTSATDVLDVARGRLLATFTNNSDSKIYLARGGDAEIGKGILLSPNGGQYEINQTNLYWGSISAIADTAGSSLCVSYSE